MRVRRLTAVAVGAVLVLFASVDAAAAAAPTTRRVSVSSSGAQGDSDSYVPSISGNGRFVAYYSRASNLVAGDTNGTYDVFVYDRWNRRTTRVSVASNGAQANGESSRPTISADGRYVAYHSRASNLVVGDTNTVRDVFVYDRATQVTTRVSVATTGRQARDGSYDPAISANGRYITYHSWAATLTPLDTLFADDVFLYDRLTRRTILVSVRSDGSLTSGGGDSTDPAISGDGRYVTYTSYAWDLVPGEYNTRQDVYLYDRVTRRTTRVSVASDGTQGDGDSYEPSISGDGRYVTYSSWASNLTAGDTNGNPDVFLHDRQTRSTTRISVASDGTPASSDSDFPAISTDGRYIGYSSLASNLVSGDSNGTYDVFLYDRLARRTTRVSVSTGGGQGNGTSHDAAISGDGRYIAYGSEATNLVAGDTNDRSDIFVHQRS